MSKLLRRSKQRLISASNDWKYVSTDDSFVDGACFQLQQSMEFALKYLAEIMGIPYERTHDIRKLVECIKDSTDISIPVLDKVLQNADTYTSWEIKSRYTDDFIAVRKDVEYAFKVASELVSYIDNFSKTAVPPKDAIEWCRKNAPEPLKVLDDNSLWEEMRDIYYKWH